MCCWCRRSLRRQVILNLGCYHTTGRIIWLTWQYQRTSFTRSLSEIRASINCYIPYMYVGSNCSSISLLQQWQFRLTGWMITWLIDWLLNQFQGTVFNYEEIHNEYLNDTIHWFNPADALIIIWLICKASINVFKFWHVILHTNIIPMIKIQLPWKINFLT